MIEEDEFNEKFDPYDVRDAFFEFICSIMANYKNYLVKKIAKNQTLFFIIL